MGIGDAQDTNSCVSDPRRVRFGSQSGWHDHPAMVIRGGLGTDV